MKNLKPFLVCSLLVGFAACDDESSSSSPNNKDAASSVVQIDAAPAADASVSDGTISDTSPSDGGADAGLSAAEVSGYYSGEWGDMVFRVVGNEIWGAYTHDQGTIVGKYVDGVLIGWWSEVPSRMAPNDAGDVEFRFTRFGNTIRMDGRWRYGTTEAWRENWNIDRVSGVEPEKLVARFQTPETFVRRPQ